MVEGSAQRNGRAVVPQASITGLIVPLDNGPDQQQIEFLLTPAPLTLGRNGAAALAPAAGASSAARLLFSSVGTVSGKTASSLVQMDRLAGNVDLVSVSVSAEGSRLMAATFSSLSNWLSPNQCCNSPFSPIDI